MLVTVLGFMKVVIVAVGSVEVVMSVEVNSIKVILAAIVQDSLEILWWILWWTLWKW